MTISADLADTYMGNPHGIYYFEALEFSHPALTDDLYYTNRSFAIEGFLDNAVPNSNRLFRPIPFDVLKPEKNAEGNQVLEISFSNITAELISVLDIVSSAPQASMTVAYRVFLSSQVDGNGVHFNQLTPPWRYEISAVPVDANAVVMQGTKVNLYNRTFPRIRYRRDTFPALA